VQPMKFLSGTEALSAYHEDWILDRQPSCEGKRFFQTKVFFCAPFQSVPLVHIGITGFDISNQDAARITAHVANITCEGFEIVLSTWLATRLWRTDICWLAIGT
jgi:H-type lectin domain